MPTFKLDEFYVRLYDGDPRDEAIARHLKQFDKSPKGAKPDEVKRLMYLGMQSLEQSPSLDPDVVRQIAQEAARQAVESSSPHLDQDVIRQAVQEAMRSVDVDFGLSDVRRVVEAALRQNLDRLRLARPDQEGAEESVEGEDTRIEESLERLGESLLH